jgi:hypothetical protein
MQRRWHLQTRQGRQVANPEWSSSFATWRCLGEKAPAELAINGSSIHRRFVRPPWYLLMFSVLFCCWLLRAVHMHLRLADMHESISIQIRPVRKTRKRRK